MEKGKYRHIILSFLILSSQIHPSFEMWWFSKSNSEDRVIIIQNYKPVSCRSGSVFIVKVTATTGDTDRHVQVCFQDGSTIQLSLDEFRANDKVDGLLRADMDAAQFAQQFTRQFTGKLAYLNHGVKDPNPDRTRNLTPDPKPGHSARHIAAGVIGGICALVAAPFVLPAIGFTARRVTVGSYAAGMMSAAAVANGGGVAVGSTVAILQAAGAVGLGAAGGAVVAGTGAVVGAAASGVAGAVEDEEEEHE